MILRDYRAVLMAHGVADVPDGHGGVLPVDWGELDTVNGWRK
jgi:hypothetical protein